MQVRDRNMLFRRSEHERMCLKRNDFHTLKAVFQLRVFYTYVHARKSLNPF